MQRAPGPDVTVSVDTDQIEQLFINLIRNAADACLEVGAGSVTVGWRRTRQGVDIWVDDEGPGLSNTANLFVPFFTTKPGGSGHRPRAVPPDRRSARGIAEARESSRRSRRERDADAAALGLEERAPYGGQERASVWTCPGASVFASGCGSHRREQDRRRPRRCPLRSSVHRHLGRRRGPARVCPFVDADAGWAGIGRSSPIRSARSR